MILVPSRILHALIMSLCHTPVMHTPPHGCPMGRRANHALIMSLCHTLTPACTAIHSPLHVLPYTHLCMYCHTLTPACTAIHSPLHVLPYTHPCMYCHTLTPACTAHTCPDPFPVALFVYHHPAQPCSITSHHGRIMVPLGPEATRLGPEATRLQLPSFGFRVHDAATGEASRVMGHGWAQHW